MQCSAASTVCLCVYVCVGALKCCYFWLPQGVTYAKGATTTKTKCTCHTTTTAHMLPSFMPCSLRSCLRCVCVCVFVMHFTGSWPVVVVATFSSGASGVSLITYATMCINFMHATCILLIRPVVVQRLSKVRELLQSCRYKMLHVRLRMQETTSPIAPPPLSLVAFPRIIDVYFCTIIGYYLL